MISRKDAKSAKEWEKFAQRRKGRKVKVMDQAEKLGDREGYRGTNGTY